MAATATATDPASTRLSSTDIARLVQNGQPLSPSILSSDHQPCLLSLLQSPPPSFPVSPYLSSLLSLISDSIHSDPSLSLLLSSLLSLFLSRDFPRDKDSSKILHLFSLFLSSLPKPHIPGIIDEIVSGLEDVVDPGDALPVDLLPRLLCIARSATADRDVDNGVDYVDSVLDKMLLISWSKPLILKLVTLLREFPPLDKSRSCEFVTKVFDELKSVDLQDLPSIAYQLLVLASKGFAKRMIIERIVRFFGERAPGSATERQVEGTVLLHVNFAVKQDPSLGQDVLGLVRSDLRALNHFAVSVLLSMARVRRFAEGAMGVLKKALFAAYRDYRISRDSKWVTDCVKDDCLQACIGIEKAIIRAVSDCNYGREHIVPTMVHFGFVLLESVEDKTNEGFQHPDGVMGIFVLGELTVKTLFEVHDMARNEIIEQCKFRILTLKPQQSLPIIKLLASMVQSFPFPMLEHVGQLKDLLDYFTFMQEKVAISLITAILPLIKFSSNLQDYIILVVRKAMFRREDAVRIAAVDAIIQLIVAEKRFKNQSSNCMQDSSSQASCSQQADLSCGPGTNLFQELSGLLRRCLSQQARLKEIMYKGLLKLVVVEPQISGAVFDLLRPHFLHFYQEDESHLLDISSCMKFANGKVCLEEPLDCLLSCISWIFLLQPHGKSDHVTEFSLTCFGFSLSQDNEVGRISSAEFFSNALMKIRNFLRNSSVEDLLAVCSWDSRHDSSEHERTIYCTSILSGVIEVILNIVVTETGKAGYGDKANLEGEFMGLINLYYSLLKGSRISKGVSDLAANSSKATSQNVNQKTDNTTKEGSHIVSQKVSRAMGPFLATSSVHQLLLSALRLIDLSYPSDNVPSKNKSQSSLLKIPEPDVKLITVALKVCHHHLKLFTSVDDADPVKTLFYEDAIVLGCPLLQLSLVLKYHAKLEMNKRNREAKGKKIADDRGELIYLNLMCLKDLFKISLQQQCFDNLIEQLIKGPLSEQDSEDGMDDRGWEDMELRQLLDNKEWRNVHMFLFKGIKQLQSELLDLSLFREFEVLADIVLMIVSNLPCELKNSYGAWAINLCRKSSFKNPKAVRSVVALAFYLRTPPNDLEVAQEIASELLKVTGSEEMDPVEKSEMFPIINCSTVNSISSLLLQLLESVIANLGWAVGKLKILTTLSYRESIEIEKDIHCTERPTMSILEETVYSRSDSVVGLLSSFAEMSLKDPQAEQVLKMTTKFYKQLAQVTKLQIAPRGCKQPLPGLKFQKLVEVACKKLTTPLYNFMSLIQRNQQENVQGKGMLNKIKRENKCIPELIFQIEDYEKYLIQLTKRTKVNLMRHAKRSTARDFKILEAKREENPPEQIDSENSEAASQDLSPQPSAAAKGDSLGSDNEDQGLIFQRKRTKVSVVVEDSE